MDLYDQRTENDIDGLIKRIEVRNFLCHDNLAIDFTAGNIHWVTGLNGSGKSAIITALVVGLGGKAIATHRGKNFQSFIKNGRDFAVIEITIKNDTDNAYNHDTYGDEIKIIRRITTSGSSQYTVKSASGDKISNSFAEITNIMLALEIQVDNPISVLNQEEAKTFSSMDSKKMYSLFRKATNLDHSINNYHQVLENCKKAEAIKHDKEKTCESLKKEYEKWKQKQEKLLLHDKIEKQLKSIGNEIFWSEVEELEREIKNLEGNIKTKKLEVGQLSSMCEGSENIHTIIENLKQKQKEHDRTIIDLNQEQKNLQDKIRKEKEKCDSVQSETNNIQYRLNKAEKNIKDFEVAIQDIQSGGWATRREEAEQEEQRAITAEKKAAERLAEAERVLDEAVRREGEVEASATAEVEDARDMRRRLEKARALYVRSRTKDPLALWGDDVSKLCRRIEQATQLGHFERQPIGPIGQYLRLKDRRWASALEHIIGNHKRTFCVHSGADSRKLLEIMNEVFGNRPKPTVSCSKFISAHSARLVEENRVQARPAALDALQVAEPVVYNFLIDNLALETVLLVPDDETAMRLASEIKNVPKNCSKIVTEDCNEFYPAPNYRSYGSDPRRAREHFLELSSEDVERQLCENVDIAEKELKVKERLVEQTKRAADQARREVAAAQSQCERIRDVLRTSRAALAAARRALAGEVRAPHHDVLEEELNKTKEEQQSLKKQVDELKVKKNEHEQKIKCYDGKIRELEEKIVENKTAKQNLQKEINKNQSKNEKRTNVQLVLEQTKDALAKMEQEILQKRQEISEKLRKQPGPPFEKPRSREVLHQYARKLRAELSALRELALGAEHLREELARARKQHRDLRAQLDELDGLIREIKEAVEERLKFCVKLELEITRRVRTCFAANLATHDYYGELVVRHSSGTLEVCATGRDSAREVRNAKALSGGERSYCTVALLLALWECVELPFYFLDEFDVCLDKTNRKIVVELLMNFAQKHPARQLVMVSPSMPHKMRKPPILHRLENPRS